ncbi:helix-turn-helix domain-containing protein [Zobellia galactanivorans]|uniref:AraC-type transcriptional regulator n=1 Tax=Zobellia galactanivorans (strain DSM 12802 / CCUG 47099 / CIP 106680 / NCIMB 13871 / Dsij) TaxID=63186 RepID=G0L6W6_ZOBGA|nr:helix-turn-helix domain-containing protein [Zobellia galactanivorans]CAZ98698.1 AraC-type transcriptional regulator [Zobellia galactanivorans]
MHTAYPPPEALLPFVSFFYEIKWERKDYGEKIEEFILPSGMGFMVFQYSGSIYGRSIGGKKPFVPKCYTTGQQINAYTLTSDDEIVALIGVAFKPAGLRKLFGFDMHTLVDTPLSTESLLNVNLTKFSHQLERTTDPQERISMVEQLLLDRVDRANKTSPMVDLGLEMMYESYGCIQVREVSDKLNVSMRYFQKKFKEVVGIPPSTFNRIVRFNNLFSEIDMNAQNDYASLGTLYNYYDFSHFYKDFKKYCGHTPREFHIERFKFIQEVFVKDSLFIKNVQTL